MSTTLLGGAIRNILFSRVIWHVLLRTRLCSLNVQTELDMIKLRTHIMFYQNDYHTANFNDYCFFYKGFAKLTANKECDEK